MPGKTTLILDNVKAGDPVLMQIPTENTLYHYTSLGPLTEIVRSRAIWASNIFYLNDAQEILYGFGRLISEINARKKEIADPESVEIYEELAGWLLTNMSTHRQVFVCAFSENGNQLSQWRAYSPTGRGVSIGFDHEKLAAKADKNGFTLAKCAYQKEDQQSIIESVLTGVMASTKLKGKDPEAHPTQSYHSRFEEVSDAIYTLCAQLKHPSFEEEAEWRLISPPFYKNTDPRIKYREGQSMLIPYVEFELSNEVDGFDLPVVIVGPTPNNNLSISAVVNYLSSQKVVQPAVFASGIPYRSW